LRERYRIVIRLLRLVPVTKETTLLDVGCGDGALTGMIYRSFGCQITGTDTSGRGLELAAEMFRKYGFRGEFRLGQEWQLPFSDRSFDVVVCAEMIEHVSEPRKTLRELKRVLKPGGYLVITTPIRMIEDTGRVHLQEWFCREFAEFCRSEFPLPALAHVQSHPVLLYELYFCALRFVSIPARFIIHCLDFLGINVFDCACTSKLHYPMQQALLIRSQRENASCA
jgi:ubiquinone/menaquinone biosynthesis C-methylase UbiE